MRTGQPRGPGTVIVYIGRVHLGEQDAELYPIKVDNAPEPGPGAAFFEQLATLLATLEEYFTPTQMPQQEYRLAETQPGVYSRAAAAVALAVGVTTIVIALLCLKAALA